MPWAYFDFPFISVNRLNSSEVAGKFAHHLAFSTWKVHKLQLVLGTLNFIRQLHRTSATEGDIYQILVPRKYWQ